MANKKLKFTTDDLSVTSDGRVVISNADVAKSLVNQIRKMDPGAAGIFDNCDCSGAQALGQVSLAGRLQKRPLAIDLDTGGTLGAAGIFDNCNCG